MEVENVSGRHHTVLGGTLRSVEPDKVCVVLSERASLPVVPVSEKKTQRSRSHLKAHEASYCLPPSPSCLAKIATWPVEVAASPIHRETVVKLDHCEPLLRLQEVDLHHVAIEAEEFKELLAVELVSI